MNVPQSPATLGLPASKPVTNFGESIWGERRQAFPISDMPRGDVASGTTAIVQRFAPEQTRLA